MRLPLPAAKIKTLKLIAVLPHLNEHTYHSAQSKREQLPSENEYTKPINDQPDREVFE